MSLRSLPRKKKKPKQNKITNFLRATVTKLRVDYNNTKDCKFRSFRFNVI